MSGLREGFEQDPAKHWEDIANLYSAKFWSLHDTQEALLKALRADSQTLHLALGEMHGQEMRAVRAAFNWVLSRIGEKP